MKADQLDLTVSFAADIARKPAPISTSCNPITIMPTSDAVEPNHALSASWDALP
jgi:hypothetical protein